MFNCFNIFKLRLNTERLIKSNHSLSIVIKTPVTKWKRARYWGDHHIATLLKDELEAIGYSVVIQILPEWYNGQADSCDVVIVLRGLSEYKPIADQINLMWNISHPDDVSLEEYEKYDKVFIASEYWTNKIKSQVSVPVETMLQCTDKDRFHEPSDVEKNKFSQKLLFVGNSRDVYRKALKHSIPTEYDLAVYGKNWEEIIPKKYIKGKYIPNEKLYLHYGSADILLNDHWDDMKEKGFISNRIYDGLACGAFILSDKVKDMGDIGNYIETYENPEELKAKIHYYLKNKNERKKRIGDAPKYIYENHTFKQRAKQFSESIDELLEQIKEIET